MTEHLRASVAAIDARLDALHLETQRLTDARGVLLKLMGQEPAAPAPAAVRVAPDAEVDASARRMAVKHRQSLKAIAKAKASVPGDRHGRILQALSRAGGPTDLMSIVHATGYQRDYVRFALAALRKSGQVLATGATLSRRFTLAGQNGRAAAQPPAADTEGDERRARASARA